MLIFIIFILFIHFYGFFFLQWAHFVIIKNDHRITPLSEQNSLPLCSVSSVRLVSLVTAICQSVPRMVDSFLPPNTVGERENLYSRLDNPGIKVLFILIGSRDVHIHSWTETVAGEMGCADWLPLGFLTHLWRGLGNCHGHLRLTCTGNGITDCKRSDGLLNKIVIHFRNRKGHRHMLLYLLLSCRFFKQIFFNFRNQL